MNAVFPTFLVKQSPLKLLFQVFFILSGTSLTVLLALNGGVIAKLLTILLSGGFIAMLTLKHRILDRIYANFRKVYLMASSVASSFCAYYFSCFFFHHYLNSEQTKALAHFSGDWTTLILQITVPIGCLSLPAIFTFWYGTLTRYFPKVQAFALGLSKLEKRYLLIAFPLISMIIIAIYCQTTAFYSQFHPYDVVYTSDTGAFFAEDSYMQFAGSQNDIRQPLFALVSLPFAVIARLASYLLFIVPFIPKLADYPIGIAMTQVLALLFVNILLCRMLKQQEAWGLLVFTTCFPFLLFALNAEQYVFHMFYLILGIYLYVTYNRPMGEIYMLTTGSLLTSGIIFPLLYDRAKSFAENIKYLSKQLGLLFVTLTITGSLTLFFTAIASVSSLMRFSGKGLPFSERLYQFINFIQGTMLSPKGEVQFTDGFFSYQLAHSTTLNLVGGILLAIAILGFVLNFRDRFAQICLGWIAFSFIILCLIGWGTQENGLILYSLYFSWAYLSLIVMGLSKLIHKFPLSKLPIVGCLISFLVIVNFRGITEIIQFGKTFYPLVK